MSTTKLRPIRLLSVVFGIHFIIFIAVISFTIYFHKHASRLTAAHSAMHPGEGAVLARIESEADISRLRSFAVAAHEGSVRDWNASVRMTNDVDTLFLSACIIQGATLLFLGGALYALIRQVPNRLTSR